MHDHLARTYAEASNRHERYAAGSSDPRAVADAHRRADEARESAQRAASRGDELRAAAARLDD
jgi:hypothetical protein